MTDDQLHELIDLASKSYLWDADDLDSDAKGIHRYEDYGEDSWNWKIVESNKLHNPDVMAFIAAANPDVIKAMAEELLSARKTLSLDSYTAT